MSIEDEIFIFRMKTLKKEEDEEDLFFECFRHHLITINLSKIYDEKKVRARVYDLHKKRPIIKCIVKGSQYMYSTYVLCSNSMAVLKKK